jgi:hypothetical protein
LRLDGVAEWSVLITPLRAVQRLALVALVWAVLLGSVTPFAVSGGALVAAWSVRTALGLLARVSVSRDAGFEPWILNDVRLMSTDLAVGVGALRPRWRTPPVDAPAPGAGWLRFFPRALQSTTSLVVIAAGLGFVRIETTNLAVLIAVAIGIWFLTASSLGRRGVGRAQFRTSYRTDAELAVISPQGLSVIGMSPVGFDVLSTVALVCGAPLVVAVRLPAPDGASPLKVLRGTVRLLTRRHAIGLGVGAGLVATAAGAAVFAFAATGSETMVVWQLATSWDEPRGPHKKTSLRSNASRRAAANRFARSEKEALNLNLHACSWAPRCP